MIYKMTLKDSADEMTFDLLEVPIVDKDIEGAVDNVTLDGNQYTDYLWLKKQFIQKWSILCDDEYTRLRGFYTRQFENADVPSYRLYYGDDIVRNFSENGERIELSISGVADGTMSLTQMDGNTIQDGTPTPSAPVPVQTVTGRQTVTVAGKNLLRNAYQATQTIYGVTFTPNADGTITANGTATNTINFYPSGSNSQYNISAGTYTLSTGTADSDTAYFTFVENNFSTEWSSRYVNARTITVPSGGGTIAPRIVIRPNTTLNNVVFKPMIERGSTATTFEPYKAQEYEINFTQNLFDESQDKRRYYLDSSGAEIANDVWDISGYIPVVAGEVYSYQGITRPGNAPYSAFYNASKAYVSSFKQATGSNVITIPDGVAFVRFPIYHDRAVGGVNDNTTFKFWDTPNQIELCRIPSTDYQDRIYKENGKWWLHKETGKITLGAQTWGKEQTASSYRFRTNAISDVVAPPNNGTLLGIKSNVYAQITASNSWNMTSGRGIAIQTDKRCIIYDADYASQTVQNLTDMLNNNGAVLYYPLATPTTTEITNEEVLEGLEALQDEAISVGQHNIYTDTPNALPTLTFDLTEYLSKSTTIIPETAVRLTLTDGGVINACGCRKDVQLTMRETIE